MKATGRGADAIASGESRRARSWRWIACSASRVRALHLLGAVVAHREVEQHGALFPAGPGEGTAQVVVQALGRPAHERQLAVAGHRHHPRAALPQLVHEAGVERDRRPGHQRAELLAPREVPAEGEVRHGPGAGAARGVSSTKRPSTRGAIAWPRPYAAASASKAISLRSGLGGTLATAFFAKV